MATSIFSELPASQTNDGNIILSVNGSATTSTSALSEIIANAGGGGGTELTAGTDLVINNGIIGVNTNGTATGNYAFAEGIGTSAFGEGSHAEGYGTLASGNDSHAEGYQTKALDSCSHAEGNETTVLGYCSHAEGYQTSAKGEWSHVEGSNTSAVKQGSHSEGTLTLASGVYSHAEGNNTSATDNEAHSEGYGTLAQGKQSHAEGYYTIAGDDYMHAGGKFNKTSADIAFVIGNGTSNARSDAFIVDWNGVASATNLQTSAGYVVTDVMLTSATNSTTSFVTNGVADLTPLYTYIKSLEDRIAALEAAQGGDGFTVNGVQPTVNGNTITVGE